MNKAIFAALAAGAAALAARYALQGEQDAASTTNDEPTILDEAVSTVQNWTADVNEDTLSNPNVQAFLTLIRTAEGTLGAGGYRLLFGGGKFDSFEDHPHVTVSRSGYTTTAAGAYQILAGTWDEIADKYGLSDFTPESQDIAALALIKRRGALADVIAGRFKLAIQKCNKEWASLPGSPYGQPTITAMKAYEVLASAGATFSTEATA
jgi:lysozyme